MGSQHYVMVYFVVLIATWKSTFVNHICIRWRIVVVLDDRSRGRSLIWRSFRLKYFPQVCPDRSRWGVGWSQDKGLVASRWPVSISEHHPLYFCDVFSSCVYVLCWNLWFYHSQNHSHFLLVWVVLKIHHILAMSTDMLAAELMQIFLGNQHVGECGLVIDIHSKL